MRFLIVLFFLVNSFSAFCQKNTGIRVFDTVAEMNAFVPDRATSEAIKCVVVSNWKDYTWNGSNGTWQEVSSVEVDPVFSGSPSFGISFDDIADYDQAYGWGNHASVGYLTGIISNHKYIYFKDFSDVNRSMIRMSNVNTFEIGNNGFQTKLNGSNVYVQNNVGIGTANISEKLHLASIYFPRIAFLRNGIGTWFVGGDNAGLSNEFQVSFNGITPFFRMATNGNVGIGVAPNQTKKLTVFGDAQATNLYATSMISATSIATDGNGKLIPGGVVSSPWITNASNIKYNTGNVGISEKIILGADIDIESVGAVLDVRALSGEYAVLVKDKSTGVQNYAVVGDGEVRESNQRRSVQLQKKYGNNNILSSSQYDVTENAITWKDNRSFQYLHIPLDIAFASKSYDICVDIEGVMLTDAASGVDRVSVQTFARFVNNIVAVQSAANNYNVHHQFFWYLRQEGSLYRPYLRITNTFNDVRESYINITTRRGYLNSSVPTAPGVQSPIPSNSSLLPDI